VDWALPGGADMTFPYPAASATPAYVMSLLEGVDGPTAIARLSAVCTGHLFRSPGPRGEADRLGVPLRLRLELRPPSLPPSITLQAQLRQLEVNAGGVLSAQQHLLGRAVGGARTRPLGLRRCCSHPCCPPRLGPSLTRLPCTTASRLRRPTPGGSHA